MSLMASQITSLAIDYSTVYSGAESKKTSKLRVTGLCAGNSPGTGEFPAQMASDAEMFPFDDVIMEQNRHNNTQFTLDSVIAMTEPFLAVCTHEQDPIVSTSFPTPSWRLIARSREFWSREIGSLSHRIALANGSTAAEVPVKFQSDHKITNTNLAASRLWQILQ